MLTLLTKLYEPIKSGNIYRESIYGKPDTFKESYLKAREYAKQYTKQNNLKPILDTQFYISDESCEDVDRFKAKFGYWDEWSGCGYTRRENPDLTKDTDVYAVCRSNPVTGIWAAL